jgi:hypothetical protein
MHQIKNFLSYKNIIKEYKAYLTPIGKENEPNSFEEALNQPIWCNAMRYRLNAIWVVVPLPNGKKKP